MGAFISMSEAICFKCLILSMKFLEEEKWTEQTKHWIMTSAHNIKRMTKQWWCGEIAFRGEERWRNQLTSIIRRKPSNHPLLPLTYLSRVSQKVDDDEVYGLKIISWSSLLDRLTAYSIQSRSSTDEQGGCSGTISSHLRKCQPRINKFNSDDK